MSEVSSFSSSDPSSTVVIKVLSVEEEEDDLDTLAFIQRVRTNVQQDLENLNKYVVSTIPNGERNIDMVILLTGISASIVASKDLLTSIFNMLTAVLELLAKRDHVEEIEIIVGGKTLILRDLRKKTAKELVEALASQHPETMEKLAAEKPLNITARVSKKRSRKH